METNGGEEEFEIRLADDVPIERAECEFILQLWHERCLKSARAHYSASSILYKGHGVITIANTAASISVLFFVNATSLKTSIFDGMSDVSFNAFASISSLILVLVSTLQYIFRWDERAREHKSAGAEFSNLQRKIERYLTGKFFRMSILHNINREYNYISRSYPLVPHKIWSNRDYEEVSKRIRHLEHILREKSVLFKEWSKMPEKTYTPEKPEEAEVAG